MSDAASFTMVVQPDLASVIEGGIAWVVLGLCVRTQVRDIPGRLLPWCSWVLIGAGALTIVQALGSQLTGQFATGWAAPSLIGLAALAAVFARLTWAGVLWIRDRFIAAVDTVDARLAQLQRLWRGRQSRSLTQRER